MTEQQFLASLTGHTSHHGLHGFHILGQEVRRKTVKGLKRDTQCVPELI